MKRIYRGQSALRIKVRTGIDLSGVTAASIRYMMPDGTCGVMGAWIADAEGGVLCHDVAAPDELPLAGWWKFWAVIRFPDGRTAPGRAVSVYVSEEGS